MREGEMVVSRGFDLYLHKLGERLPGGYTPMSWCCPIGIV